MQKKTVFIIILILTIFLLGSFLLFTGVTRVNRLVVSEEKWNNIQKERTESDNISLKNISLNDYPLIIDNNNNKLYYSFVETSRKYNPKINYIGNQDRAKVYVKESLTEDIVKNSKTIEVMIFNNNNYRVYQLITTKNPMIDIHYSNMTTNTTRGDILVVDNQVNANQKIIRTSASITITNNKDYIISMRKKSVGRNDRKNNISLFGITMDHEFTLRKEDTKEESSNTKIDVFVNSEYQGEYRLDYKEQRGE